MEGEDSSESYSVPVDDSSAWETKPNANSNSFVNNKPMDPTEEEAKQPSNEEVEDQPVGLTKQEKKGHRRSRSFNEVFGSKKFPQIVIGRGRRTNSPGEEGEADLDCDIDEGALKGSLTQRGGHSAPPMPPLPPYRPKVLKSGRIEEVEVAEEDDEEECGGEQHDEQESEMDPVEGDESVKTSEGEKKEGAEGEGSSEEQSAASLKGSGEGDAKKGEEEGILELLRKDRTDEFTIQIRSLEACGYNGLIEELKYGCFSFDPSTAIENFPVEKRNKELASTLVDNNSTTPLHLLASRGDVKGLESFLSKGKADVDVRDCRRCTPLHVAALFGHSEAVELLLKNGANGGAIDDEGNQPLHYLACSAGVGFYYRPLRFISLALDLVKAGSEVNLTNKRGRTCLHELAHQENWMLCAAFLYFFPSVDVNSADMKGETPLHFAVRFNQPRLVEVLLWCGADNDMVGNHGNPREVAVQLDHVEIIKIIDSTTKDQSEMLLKKSVDCFSSFYGQQEIRSLEKKKEEVAALISSAEKGPDIFHDTYGFVFEMSCKAEYSLTRHKIYKLHLTQHDVWRSFLGHNGSSRTGNTTNNNKIVAQLLKLNNKEKDRRQLRKMVHAGVPVEYRGAVWYVFSGAAERMMKSPIRYSSLKNTISKKFEEAIDKDLPRTYPNHNYFSYFHEGLDALKRILNAYALYNRGTGYCQGMNFIAGFLLLFMTEEQAFWTLSVIVEEYLKDYFCESMVGLLVDSTILSQLLCEKTPKVAFHFENLQVPMNYLATKFLQKMYIGVMPTETVVRIWDRIMFDGPQVLIEVLVAITQICEGNFLNEMSDGFECLEFYGAVSSRLYDCEHFLKELKKASNSRLFTQPMGELRRKNFQDAIDSRHEAFQVRIDETLDEPLDKGEVVCKAKRKKAIPVANKVAGTDLMRGDNEQNELASLMKDLSARRMRDSLSGRPPRPARPANLSLLGESD